MMTRLIMDHPMDLLLDPGFAGWFMPLGLPPHLAARIGDGPFRLTLDDFARPVPNIAERVAMAIAWSERSHAPAHGALHASQVVNGVAEGVWGLEEYLGVALPAGMLHYALLGAAAHDWAHPGAAYFSDASPMHKPTRPAGLPVPIDSCAVEYHTAFIRDQFAEHDSELSVPGRLLEVNQIWSTTERANHKLGWRIQPRSFHGCLINAADVLPTGDHTSDTFFEMSLMCAEVSPFPRPKTIASHTQRRLGFLQYVLERFDRLDIAACRLARAAGRSESISLTEELGWRDRVHRSIRQAHLMSQRNVAATAIVNAALALHDEPPME